MNRAQKSNLQSLFKSEDARKSRGDLPEVVEVQTGNSSKRSAVKPWLLGLVKGLTKRMGEATKARDCIRTSKLRTAEKLCYLRKTGTCLRRVSKLCATSENRCYASTIGRCLLIGRSLRELLLCKGSRRCLLRVWNMIEYDRLQISYKSQETLRFSTIVDRIPIVYECYLVYSELRRSAVIDYCKGNTRALRWQ